MTTLDWACGERAGQDGACGSCSPWLTFAAPVGAASSKDGACGSRWPWLTS